MFLLKLDEALGHDSDNGVAIGSVQAEFFQFIYQLVDEPIALFPNWFRVVFPSWILRTFINLKHETEAFSSKKAS